MVKQRNRKSGAKKKTATGQRIDDAVKRANEFERRSHIKSGDMAKRVSI